jgi:hypothetical protein
MRDGTWVFVSLLVMNIMANLVGYSRKMIDITGSVLYTFIVR